MTKRYTWLPIEPKHAGRTQLRAERRLRPTRGADANGMRRIAEMVDPDGDVAEQWLYVRDHESIVITRTRTATLRVFGPGGHRNSMEFETVAGLEQFRASYEQRILNEGWARLHLSDRRT